MALTPPINTSPPNFAGDPDPNFRPGHEWLLKIQLPAVLATGAGPTATLGFDIASRIQAAMPDLDLEPKGAFLSNNERTINIPFVSTIARGYNALFELIKRILLAISLLIGSIIGIEFIKIGGPSEVAKTVKDFVKLTGTGLEKVDDTLKNMPDAGSAILFIAALGGGLLLISRLRR